MKYIDADRLQANIKEIEKEFKTGNYYLDNSEQAVGYYNALMDFEKLVFSLQQEQPDFPTTDEQMKEFLATHPKVEVPQKYKTPDWLFKKQEQPSLPDNLDEIARS